MMKSNIVLKGLAALVVSALGIVVIANKDDKKELAYEGNEPELASIETGPAQEDNGLAIDPMKDDYLEQEYGVDVDSPVETMRTLTNETRAVREDSQKLQEENKKLKQEVNKLLKMEDSLTNRINSRFTTAEKNAEAKQRELAHDQDLTKSLIQSLENKLKDLEVLESKGGGKKTASGYDINEAGIPSGLGYDENGNSVNYDQVIWVNPTDAVVDKADPSKISLPDFGSLKYEPPTPLGNKKTEAEKRKERLIRAYTIPDNATLIGSVSMSALLGRIPTNGQVVDPYPFKVIVGEENLSSNGIKIPGVTGITMSGIAKGDWTLSCVSGDITSMTFTFQDGTIVTIPEPGTKATERLAWFSDIYGTPCVTGQRITNAVEYLTSRVGLTAAASYANAQAASQFSTSTNATGGFTSGLTGDPTTVAKNTAISSGLNEITDWLDQRMQDSFDAIYAPPGTELEIHVTEELQIDYDPEGRKVNHYANINRHTDSHLD